MHSELNEDALKSLKFTLQCERKS